MTSRTDTRPRKTERRAERLDAADRRVAERQAAATADRRNVLGRRAALVGTVLVVTVLFVALPVRSYLHQGGDAAEARAELRRVEQDNATLEERSRHLSDPDEVARIARRDYGLVSVGEESYSVLPPSSAGLIMPRAWPFDRIEAAVRTASGS